MVSICIRSVIYAIVLAGNVGANHIKRHQHLSPRGQCRPRLPSTDTGEASTIHAVSSVHLTTHSSVRSKSTSTPITHTTKIVSAIPVPSAATLAHTASATTAATHASAKAAATAAVQPLSATFIPNSIKAGIAGGDSYSHMKDHIGWWYDWYAAPVHGIAFMY